MWRVVLILAGMALCAQALADAGPAPRRILTIDEQQKWSGVGRLNHASGGFCSAVLIRPDAVLTAAHCVIDEATGREYKPTSMRFVAGLRAGVYTAHRRVATISANPDWDGYQGAGRIRITGDLAVVRLESPITPVEAKIFEVGGAPEVGDDVTLVSYGRGREAAMSLQFPCQIVETWKGVAAVNCDVVKGTSGAPIFRDGRIVGIVSATDDGPQPRRSYAALAEDLVDDLLGGRRSAGAAPARPTASAGSLFKSAPRTGGRLPGGKTAPTR